MVLTQHNADDVNGDGGDDVLPVPLQWDGERRLRLYR
jgi:hypothetical protein